MTAAGASAAMSNCPEHLTHLLDRLEGVKRNGNGNGHGYTALCPVHGDKTPSLSIGLGENNKILLKCFAQTCQPDRIVAAVGLTMSALFPSKNSGTVEHPGLTLAQLASAKGFTVDFLKSFGLTDCVRQKVEAVRIPYHHPGTGGAGGTGTPQVRYRLALERDPVRGDRRFAWKTGAKVQLYGLETKAAIARAGWVLLVEGESDVWTGRLHRIPVLGVPGMATWKAEWAPHLQGLEVFAWQEPKADAFSEKISASIPGLRVIRAPEGIKDLNEAHLKGRDVRALVEELKATAPTFAALQRERMAAQRSTLHAAAESVLAAEDPLELVKAAVRAMGYGGAIEPVLIVYLSATSRVLAQRQATMPVHLMLIGSPSTGKSFTMDTALALLPSEGKHTVDASSPRVLIYDTTELRHRVLVFREADNVPRDEEHPAASAIRGLLQEHALKYMVTVRDPETSDWRVKSINKPGPTVFMTSGIRRLEDQLDSRLFTLEIPDEPEQIAAALKAQSRQEVTPAASPDQALIAFQALLQTLAPFEVVVPFATLIGDRLTATSPRVLRDFARLMSLIKAVTVLRHYHRRRDLDGRFVAEVEDYKTVRDVIGKMYQSSAGVSPGVRDAVEKVGELSRGVPGGGPVSVTALKDAMKISKAAASRRVNAALKAGWLVNAEQRKGYPYALALGEPLPDECELPTADAIQAGCSTVPPVSEGEHTPSDSSAFSAVSTVENNVLVIR